MHCIHLLLLSGLATVALQTPARGADKMAGGTLSIYLENDLFAGTIANTRVV